MKHFLVLIVLFLSTGLSVCSRLETLSKLLDQIEKDEKRAATVRAKCGVQSIVDDGKVHERGTPFYEEGDCGTNKFGSKRSENDDLDLLSLLKKVLAKRNLDDKRVVGGKTTKEGRYPWMAAFMEITSRGYGQFCGGALIAGRWVLTAAHCVEEDRVDPCSYAVQLGENTLVWRSDDIEIIKLDRIIKHKDYKGETSDPHDIALLRLSRPATLKEADIEEVCLNMGEAYDPKTCTVAGWGVNQAVTEETLKNKADFLSYSRTLQQAVLPQLSEKECKELITDFNPATICVGSNNGRDVCSGDSGGPYVCKGYDGKWYDIGVASYVINGCAIDDSPAVYVSVRYHIEWIKDVISRYGGM